MTFRPSRPHWPCGIGTTTFADFSEHGVRYRIRPAFQASLTHGYASEISPNKGRSCCQEHVICPCPSATSTSAHSSGSVSLSAASSPGVVGLYVVSVRHLAGLGENVADDDLAEDSCPIQLSSNRTIFERQPALRAHSQASSPRFVASPQLPSPRTVFQWKFIWYHDSLKETGTKYRGLAPHKITPIVGRTATEHGIGRLQMETTLAVPADEQRSGTKQ